MRWCPEVIVVDRSIFPLVLFVDLPFSLPPYSPVTVVSPHREQQSLWLHNTWPPPSTCLSERSCWLTSGPATTTSASAPALSLLSPCQFNPLIFRCTDGCILWVSWYAVQRHLFSYSYSYGSLISFKLKGREKRNDSCCHAADVTPKDFWKGNIIYLYRYYQFNCIDLINLIMRQFFNTFYFILNFFSVTENHISHQNFLLLFPFYLF